MNKRRTFGKTVLAGVLMAGFASPALASNYNTLPEPVQRGDITYITGGIGYNEEHELNAQAKNYNLLITDANKKGQFTAGTDFTIQNRNGREMIKVEDAGPLFYAKLPPGNYKVTATTGNQHHVQDIKIVPHKARGGSLMQLFAGTVALTARRRPHCFPRETQERWPEFELPASVAITARQFCAKFRGETKRSIV